MNDKADRIGFIVKATLTLLALIVCALLMFTVAAITLFQCRRFYAERIAAPFGGLILKIWRIDMVVHQAVTPARGQRVYISNHTSAVDVFALVALGLPNTRFFLSGYLRKILSLGLIGYLIGIFWTVPQQFAEQRVRIFQRAARVLRQTGESVYLSPEGRRVTSGEIGAFNKGAFHLATDLGAPIVPMYIHVPAKVDPGMGLNAGRGAIHVHFGETIDTANWSVTDLVANKERVRDLYVRWHQEVTGAGDE